MPDSANPQTRLITALAGRYRIERALGQGGMATVYLAEDLKHDRRAPTAAMSSRLLDKPRMETSNA